MNNFFFEISFHDIDLMISKDINLLKRLNKTLNVIIYKRFIFISHINLLIYMN